MKNVKTKLTLIMICTTLILFFITFLSIYLYQKNYIFDKAIESIENELKYYTDYDENSEILYDSSRFFNVETIFLEESDELYFTNKEKFLIDLYKKGDYRLGEIEKAYSDHGEYYFIVSTISEEPFIAYDLADGEGKEIPIMLYIDITSSNNVIEKINIIFLVMFVIMIIVEGLVGIYLGSKFENSQNKLKHFFQNASHELKTPLMSIQGYAEGIKSGVVDDTVMASQVIINNSERMRLLIDEILNISKLDSKQYILKKDSFDIRDIIEESLENFKITKNSKQIKLNLEYDIENSQVVADALQIYKAINTVIDNAFKFAISEVNINLYQDKKFINIDIYNDGKNISSDNAKHIFDRFYSGNDFSTGIGLAMAKEIIKLSKGDIIFKNVEGGVLFTISLPNNLK